MTVKLRIDATGRTDVWTFDQKVQASDGAVYNTSLYPQREPQLQSIDLSKGKFVTGWLTLEVPADLASQLTLLYSRGIGEETVSVSLPAPS